MMKIFTLIIILLLIANESAIASDRFVTKIELPSGQTVIVSEGEHEARSIGSFSIRLYQAAPAGDETTFFISGLIDARDGFIEKVILDDINGDEKLEVIVVIRSVGTGGYLSAHAFTIDKQQLILSSTVEGLQSAADPVAALSESVSR